MLEKCAMLPASKNNSLRILLPKINSSPTNVGSFYFRFRSFIPFTITARRRSRLLLWKERATSCIAKDRSLHANSSSWVSWRIGTKQQWETVFSYFEHKKALNYVNLLSKKKQTNDRKVYIDSKKYFRIRHYKGRTVHLSTLRVLIRYLSFRSR